MAKITTSWTKIKEVYCGWDGYHDIYWRMYARISAQSGSNTTVSVEGRLYISGNAGSYSSWTTTTCGGHVGNYSSWGQSAAGTYYVGETTLWSGSDTTSSTSMGAGVRFYSSPWGWTGENLYLSDTLTFDPATSPPTGLTVSLSEVYTNGAKFNVSISSYGIPNNASGRYIEAAILAQSTYGATYKYNIASNVSSSAITVTNASTRGTLTIRPNTQYYYGAYADNTKAHISIVRGRFVTKAEAPTILFVAPTSASAQFSYSVPADGGHYDRIVQYSLDGGVTWRTAVTISGGSAKSGTFNVNGLLSGASYTMQTRISTTAGTTNGEDVAFDTLVSEVDNKNILYGSANGEAKEARIIYGSVNDEAKPINKLYGAVADIDYFRGSVRHMTSPYSVEGLSPYVFRTKIKSMPGLWDKRASFNFLRVIGPKGAVEGFERLYNLLMYFKDGTSVSIRYDVVSVIRDFGIVFRDPLPYPTYETEDIVYLTPDIVTKLIQQGFGHIDYS